MKTVENILHSGLIHCPLLIKRVADAHNGFAAYMQIDFSIFRIPVSEQGLKKVECGGLMHYDYLFQK